MIYLEYFETHLYGPSIPDNIKPKEWKRYVDDCFLIYEHSDESFNEFLSLLNTLDDHIKFTCERSKPGVESSFPGLVIEALPFLDLMILRCLDRRSNTLSNKICIYRKACHSGSYVHAFSSQPISVKRAVIRNMFLRAYRYCDILFLEAEERKIYDDFEKLGYNRYFITKAKLSARKGRDHEIEIREGRQSPNPPRERSRFHISLPYNRYSKGLSYRFRQRGIDVSFSNIDSLKNRITSKTHDPSTKGVYILTCKKENCEQVYVGQSQDITNRSDQHTSARRNASKSYYASAKHNGNGNLIETTNAIVPYKSKSLAHRLIIETALIHLCSTVKGNKASINNRDMDILGPIILNASPIDWKLLSSAQPSFRHNAVPRNYRRFFLLQNQRVLPTFETTQNSDITPRPPEILQRNHTRSRGVITEHLVS